MAFNDDVVKDGRGRALRLDVSLDNWSTISYRYGSIAGELDGANWYEARLLNEPTVRRALGQNRIATSGGCEVVLANPDGGVDWLCGGESITDASKARFKLYVVLFDPSAPTSFTSKLLGDFFLGDWPRQTPTAVHLALQDAFLAPLSTGAALPTIADWAAVGTPATNPLRAGAGNGLPSYGLPDVLTADTPIQLAFGEDWVTPLPPILPWENTVYGRGKLVVPICCTTDNAAVTQADITNLRVEIYKYPGQTSTIRLDVAQSVTLLDPSDGTATTTTLWTVEKSPAITKAGKTFYVLYLVVDAGLGIAEAGSQTPGGLDPVYNIGFSYVGTPDGYSSWLAGVKRSKEEMEFAWGYPPGAVLWQRDPSYYTRASSYAAYASRVAAWWVKGAPLSARTVAGPEQHAVDIATDLVTHYAAGSLAINTTEAARVKAGNPMSRAAGVVQPWWEYRQGQPPPSMRQVLTGLAQSADIDIFVDWSGLVSFASDVWDYDVATQGASLITIAETRQGSIERRVAGYGERGAPFNRLYFEGGRDYAAEGLPAGFPGPFDFELSDDGRNVLLADRVLEAVLQQGWRPYQQQRQSPWYWRNIDPRARDRIRFVTSLEGLQLELGAYFKVEWTDNRGAPYASAVVCQCESISYLAQSDEVEIEAIWRDDTTDARYGYLLDDETLLVRTKVGSGNCLLGSSANVNFDGTVDLLSMGVAAGDLLVLRDASEGATSFAANAAYRIASVATATELNTTSSIASSATLADAEWYIVAGATTYETAIGDLSQEASYPDGGEMYGKATDASGDFSDTSEGNRLNNG